MDTQSLGHSIEPIYGREIERQTGWKYKALKLGPLTLPYYASPESQLILVSFVCFLCPGMFNALNGLGGGGQLDDDAYASDASNCALYATFAVVGFFAGTIVNTLGIRFSLSFGGFGYCVYVSSYLCFNHTKNFGYVVFAGVLLGSCAGILWSAQGAIMMSYPPEKLKGRYISWFWIIFNLGAVIGSVVTLGLNIDNDTVKGKGVSNATYIGFLILTGLGACLSWTLVDAKHVVRRDGSKIILMKHPTWKSEIIGLWETLRSDPYIIFLFPLFFASNWFYTYQFQDVNLARFNVRTRALNNTLYWLAQMIGALVFGFGLDFPNIRRTTRAKFAWVIMFILTFAVWGGGYVFQRRYTRKDIQENTVTQYDWSTDGFVGPMFLYVAYGFYDAAWQTCVYWLMGAITNNSRKLANFAGFYKGIQSAGAAIIWRLNGKGTPYMNMFASSWILLAGSLVVALPVILLKVKDTVPVEEDLKFTDETIDDLVTYRHSEQGKA
ncbi:MFS general substrate transporter [Dothidotthia symphoricarpi CBS 119687]|uniref:MFS general substrate transporter n=1 Tax=Dothidotthia symphoricarpi CBS 119687 TaxID=1392245 RepID=A0A6A6A517_9PLEO|nr:MFS general substrate transporter [Dothidotthia symphoricarpi CBS 119687]KAF2125858.1 MFS general substrate transporter [Dothidotthia symphoricarpi CBS 119687]